MRLRAIKSYTASRKPAGINRNTAVSENGNPSRLNIRRTAEERISTRPASTTMIEPIPPSGRPACRENAVPDSDCLAVNRKTSLRSKWSKKSTQRLQNAHSPSKTTTACRIECTSLLSQAESWHPFELSALTRIIGSHAGCHRVRTQDLVFLELNQADSLVTADHRLRFPAENLAKWYAKRMRTGKRPGEWTGVKGPA